jgi:hypothetical protein
VTGLPHAIENFRTGLSPAVVTDVSGFQARDSIHTPTQSNSFTILLLNVSIAGHGQTAARSPTAVRRFSLVGSRPSVICLVWNVAKTQQPLALNTEPCCCRHHVDLPLHLRVRQRGTSRYVSFSVRIVGGVDAKEFVCTPTDDDRHRQCCVRAGCCRPPL